MEKIVSISPDVMGGVAVFTGTRVPIQTLVDYLKSGHTIDDFLEGFPTVSKRQVTEFLDDAEQRVVSSVLSA
jgi:uncharacterized protein (DUF433 family)